MKGKTVIAEKKGMEFIGIIIKVNKNTYTVKTGSNNITVKKSNVRLYE